MKNHASFLHRKKPAMAMLWIAVAAATWSTVTAEQNKTLEELQEAVAQEPSAPQRHADLGDRLLETNRFEEAVAAYRQASELGGDYTARRGIFYDGKLYLKEVYSGGFMECPVETAYLLALDPKEGKVLERHRLPGIAESFTIRNDAVHITYRDWEVEISEAVIVFSRGAFDRPVWYGGNLYTRMNSLRSGHILASNFGGDLQTREYVPGAKFDSRPEEVYDDVPKTLDELEAALREAIDRDPTQPWHLFYLGQTLWSQEQGEEAEKIWEAMFTEDYPAIPYYEYAWMANYYERLGQRTWADRAYEEALRRRRQIPQPIEWCMSVERIINLPIVRAAAWASQKGVDPERQRLWLERAREISGVCEAGEFAAAAWERYFREQGEAKKAEREAAYVKKAVNHPLNMQQQGVHMDYEIFVSGATLFGALLCWLVVLINALRRQKLQGRGKAPGWLAGFLNALIAGGLVVFLFPGYLFEFDETGESWMQAWLSKAIIVCFPIAFALYLWFRKITLRALVASVSRKERFTVLAAVVPFAICMVCIAKDTNQLSAIAGLPMGVADSLGHDSFVLSLEKRLKNVDTDDVRYAAAVVNHMHGNAERARELYETLPDDPRTRKNLAVLQRGDFVPAEPLRAEELFRGYASRPWREWLRRPWNLPYEESSGEWAFFKIALLLSIALGVAFWWIPSETQQPPPIPAKRLRRWSWKTFLFLVPGGYDLERRAPFLGWFVFSGCVLALICLCAQTAWIYPSPTPGIISSIAMPNIFDAFPFPHALAEGQGLSEFYYWEIFWTWSGAKIFWLVVTLAGIFSLGVHVSRLRRIWNL
jgi:tetratricopeptide (TPR) repeat protein